MVRFAPVISSAAVARAQANSRGLRAGNSDLTPVKHAPGRQVRLPSLYPTVSLRSLRARGDIGETSRSYTDQARNTSSSEFRSPPAFNVTEQRQYTERTNAKGEENIRGRETDRSLSGYRSTRKVKGTSLVVGAAGILRAATVFAVDNFTAESTVQQAEEQIEEPVCEVSNFR